MNTKDLKEGSIVEKKSKETSLIETMESQYPETTSEFKRIQKMQYFLFCRKQHDYGPTNISVGSNLETPEEVDLSMTGIWFRINDKVQRIKNLLINKKANAVKNESIVDSFFDLSNYGIMAMIVKNGKWGK